MKKSKEWKHKIKIITGLAIICGIGILTRNITREWSLEDKVENETSEIKIELLEETKRLPGYTPTLEEKMKLYQIKSKENKQKNIISEESIEIAEQTEPISLEEMPTVMINGEESSFISKGKIDENGNIVAVKPVVETTRIQKEDIERTEEKGINSGKTAWENLWDNAGGSGKENTKEDEKILDFQLSGEHTGY